MVVAPLVDLIRTHDFDPGDRSYGSGIMVVVVMVVVKLCTGTPIHWTF